MHKISILLPTRGRSDRLENLLKNISETCSDSNKLEFCFFIDEDDTLSRDVITSLKSTFDIKLVSKNGVIFSDMWNHAYSVATGDLVMICGDDVVFETLNWDLIVEAEFLKFPDGILYLASNDLAHQDALGCHGFLSRTWIDILGYVTPNMFVYNWADVWIDDIAKMINRRVFRADLVVNHKHWAFGRALKDATYSKNASAYDSLNSNGAISQLYVDLLETRKQDADLLRKHIEAVA